jgi:acyl carrier protein
MINRGGEKIAPAEVDAALLAHPAVARTVTFAIPHPTLHEEVAAAVVLRAEGQVTESALRQFLFERLSPFKVPRRIWIVADLALGPTGKPLRREAQTRFASLASTTATAAGAEPMSPMERTLAALWARVLDRPRVEAGDDFFLLGGDSLSWVKLIVAIESELKIELPLEDFLRRSTVRELADWLERAPKTRAAPEKLDSGISALLRSPIAEAILNWSKRMARRKRRNHSPAFKTQFALAASKGDKTLAKLAQSMTSTPTRTTPGSGYLQKTAGTYPLRLAPECS